MPKTISVCCERRSVNYIQFTGHLWELFCGICCLLPPIQIRTPWPWRSSLSNSDMLSFVGMKSCKVVFTSRYVASTCSTFFQLIPLEGLVLEDLIRNVLTLFDDQPSTSPPIPSPAAETTSKVPSDSFLSAELSQPPEVDSVGLLPDA
jgi:hypothetical protein